MDKSEATCGGLNRRWWAGGEREKEEEQVLAACVLHDSSTHLTSSGKGSQIYERKRERARERQRETERERAHKHLLTEEGMLHNYIK